MASRLRTLQNGIFYRNFDLAILWDTSARMRINSAGFRKGIYSSRENMEQPPPGIIFA